MDIFLKKLNRSFKTDYFRIGYSLELTQLAIGKLIGIKISQMLDIFSKKLNRSFKTYYFRIGFFLKLTNLAIS